MARQRTPAVTAVLAACVPLALLAACGSDDGAADGGGTTTPASADAADAAGEVTASGISPERCEANKAAGTITYLSGFDFSASASIVEVIVAEDKGYFDAMCLDVELKPSFSVANYTLVAANESQFASAGSYAEIADFNAANDADLVVVALEGKTAIDGLIVK